MSQSAFEYYCELIYGGDYFEYIQIQLQQICININFFYYIAKISIMVKIYRYFKILEFKKKN